MSAHISWVRAWPTHRQDKHFWNHLCRRRIGAMSAHISWVRAWPPHRQDKHFWNHVCRRRITQ